MKYQNSTGKNWDRVRWFLAYGQSGLAYTNVSITASDTSAFILGAIACAYDALNRRTNMTDSVGITSWRHDEAGRLVGESGPFGTPEVQVAYDPNGRLSRRVWARGVETDYAYDVLGQLVSIDYSDSTPDVAFTYDRLGRQLTVTDILGTRTNVYDALNLLEERHPDGTALVRSYDAYGRAAGIALGPNYAVGYGYDEFGRFSTVAVSNGATFTYSYVPNSSLLSIGRLREELAAWERRRNQEAAKVDWQFRTPDARIKLISLYPPL